MRNTNNDLFLLSVQLNEAFKLACEQDRHRDAYCIEDALLCILKRLNEDKCLKKKEECSYSIYDDTKFEGFIVVLFHFSGYKYEIYRDDLGEWIED